MINDAPGPDRPDPWALAGSMGHQSCARESWLVPIVCRPIPPHHQVDVTMASISPLRYISPETLVALHASPTPKIRTDADVEAWKQTQGYSDYSIFLRWLSEVVVGCSLPRANNYQSQVSYCKTFARSKSSIKSCLNRASIECLPYSTS